LKEGEKARRSCDSILREGGLGQNVKRGKDPFFDWVREKRSQSHGKRGG